jgi:hypothetical protein
MQTPQGLDATHSDELFTVKRDHIGTNSGAQRASSGGPKLLVPNSGAQRASLRRSETFGPKLRSATGLPQAVRNFWDVPTRPALRRNTQPATMQTPQGLDATHSDELFTVKRDHIGTNSGAQRASLRRSETFGPKLRSATGLPPAVRNFWDVPTRPACAASTPVRQN